MFDALATLLIYQALGLDPSSHLGAALHFFCDGYYQDIRPVSGSHLCHGFIQSITIT